MSKKVGPKDILPFPLLVALLEEQCSLSAVDDLLITLAPGSPDTARSAWGFAIACTAAEAALKGLGFSRKSFDSVRGSSLKSKARMVAIWMAHGGDGPPVKRRSLGGDRASTPSAQVAPPSWSFGGGPANREMRVGGSAPAPVSSPRLINRLGLPNPRLSVVCPQFLLSVVVEVSADSGPSRCPRGRGRMRTGSSGRARAVERVLEGRIVPRSWQRSDHSRCTAPDFEKGTT
jgi:hypothetical protein